MRIGFVLPSFAGGGAERVMLTLLGALDPARFEVELAVFDASGPLADLIPETVAVRELRRRRLRRAVPALVRWLRAWHAEAAVSTFGYVNLALLAVRPLLAARTRILVREANTPSLSLAELRAPALTAAAYRLLYPTADAVLCQHQGTASEMAGRFRVAPERVRLLPNPVDTERLRAAAHAPRRAPGPGRRFVAAGRLTHQKGFDRLIDLFADTGPEDRLVVFGEGPDRDALERRARWRGVEKRVLLAGFECEPWPWYAGADALLLPSRWEGLPNVALEALACGTRVIATLESGGVAEIAEAAPEGAVRVVPWGHAFARAVSAVRPDVADRPRPSLLPRAYELGTVVGRFVDILETC